MSYDNECYRIACLFLSDEIAADHPSFADRRDIETRRAKELQMTAKQATPRTDALKAKWQERAEELQRRLKEVKDALDRAGAYDTLNLAARVDSLDSERVRCVNEARAAEQRVRELEKDAGRYRWLKTHHLQLGPDNWIRTGDDLDEAIDSAIQAAKGES